MKPSLEDMQVFLAVVEARSFTLAADRLERTKSAVSQTITRLESDIGTRLLYRSTRSLSLTEAGAEFYAHCREIKDIYNSALASLRHNSDKLAGSLSVTAPHALCEPLIVPAIIKLAEQHPQLKVRLLANDSPMDLIESQVDLAIRVGNLELQSAKVSKLGLLEESLYASPQLIEKQCGIPPDLSELQNWPHIANDWQGTPLKYELGNEVLIRATPKVRCNSLHDIVQLVEAGIGIARLPDIITRKMVGKGTLCPITPIAAAPIHYMHLFSQRPPAKVQTFIKAIKAQLQAFSAQK
ncbi:LysR family transcriptional regulator [Microbulbifer sp. SSSA002]|uniref:LysR family transcriptional regulator n=1 Tax=unclassified Microbulbifer TaxID=2619833 RepID=UPI0040394335